MSKTAKTVVLVADDEPSTRAMVSGHLRAKGYQVHEAADGDEAWTMAHEHLPHIVVLDVMMPGMSGWEVCRKIREAVSLAHTGVVMLTGIGENLNEMTSPLYGADAYLDKPFAFSGLDRKIKETLAARKPRSSADFVAGIVGAGKGKKKAEPKPKAKAKAAPKKAAPKKATKKAAPKKATKKAAPKKAAKKKVSKKKTAKRAAKKAVRAVAKKAKKTTKRSAKKAAKKTTKRSAKKAAKKATKRVAKRAAPKKAAKRAPSRAKRAKKA